MTNSASLAFHVILTILQSCCNECRMAPGSPQRLEAAKIVRALIESGLLPGRYNGV